MIEFVTNFMKTDFLVESSLNSQFILRCLFQIGGDSMFSMMYEANFTYDSSMPIYENSPPPFPYTLDYKMDHDCMIPPCPKKAYPGKDETHLICLLMSHMILINTTQWMKKILKAESCVNSFMCLKMLSFATPVKILVRNF